MNRFQPKLENLEARTLMAGNVFAEVDAGGDLEIDGDNNGNSISVYQLSNDDWVVQGNVSNGSLTRIDGQSTFIGGREYSFKVFSNVTRDINVDLDGGNDRLEMYANYGTASLPRDLDIEMDSGADTVILRDLRVADDLDIDTGSGGDYVYLEDITVGFAGVDGGNNDLSIDAGGDFDIVTLNRVTVQDDLYVSGEDLFSDTGVWVGDYYSEAWRP